MINGFTYPLRDVSIGLPQGSPLLPVLWIIYIHALLKKINKISLDKINISFINNISLIAEGKDVEDVAKLLGEAGL